MINNIKSKAFTLAEVLIVISIIGVVAAITLPNIKDSADDQIYVAKAKKIYAELETAYTRVNLKYGNMYNWEGVNKNDALGRKMSKYLNSQCTGQFQVTGCGTTLDYDTDSFRLTLDDGASIGFPVVANNSTNGMIIIDVDGSDKGPNSLGEDVFYAYVHQLATGSELHPYPLGLGTMSEGVSPEEKEYLQWVIQNGNEEYNNCTGAARWITQTTCN